MQADIYTYREQRKKKKHFNIAINTQKQQQCLIRLSYFPL